MTEPTAIHVPVPSPARFFFGVHHRAAVRGIGAAPHPKAFLRQGARVAFFVQSAPSATAFCDTMEREGDGGARPLFIACDITDCPPQLEAAIARAAEAHGPPTVLVGNARANEALRHTTLGIERRDGDRNQAINLRARYFFAAKAGGVWSPGMRTAGGGAIVERVVDFTT